MRIAVYGKGGIGKSTIASNLSVGLASGGKRVLHIGCDPKGDSCQVIMGRMIPDFVQMLTEKGSELQTEDIIFTGKCGYEFRAGTFRNLGKKLGLYRL